MHYLLTSVALFQLFNSDDPILTLVTMLRGLGFLGILLSIPWLAGVRRIPNGSVGIVEKIWSSSGSLADGRLIALNGEAGFQAELLRGGIHFGYWHWQYRIHRAPLTVVPQGTEAYVFARDGESLAPDQTLGRVVGCNDFQSAADFLAPAESGPSGQRGRQRAVLREGVYAINLALFIVLTDDQIYQLDSATKSLKSSTSRWQSELKQVDGFHPLVIGRQGAEDADERDSLDDIGIVTIHDGPALEAGEIIAGPVQAGGVGHDEYQDVAASLRLGGRRGRQLEPLTDGTYFLNRWFASVERVPKTVVSIGEVGVVVSYFGDRGQDLTGAAFRHGESVGEGERGVHATPLGPGKYAFNTYAGCVHRVPTTNFVLHWVTGKTEAHRYDESLMSIDLVTADAYEPVLPLSVVVHIDYQKAASVVQRFGEVKKLITQTLDPMLSAYFRDIAHKKTMLALLHERDQIQAESREALARRFERFDIELVDVLIGKPDMGASGADIEILLGQLRMRQLAREQVVTYEEQVQAAEKLRHLRLSEAHAQKQTELTSSEVDIGIAANHGEAQLVRARKDAEMAVLHAEAESRSRELIGEGAAKATLAEGEAEAQVQRRKIESYGDPRLFALAEVSSRLADSKQALVPERLFIGASSRSGAPGSEDSGACAPEVLGLISSLLALLVSDRAGLGLAETSEPPEAA